MAGSPVFKFKPSSCKKQRLHRKLSLQNVSENQSKHLPQFPVTDPKPDSSDQRLETKTETSSIQNVTNRTEPNKSISSSLSSFVFPSKKCAKRKLNFDVDADNDDVSSLRFSDKNLSLCGFRSKTSSVADQRSLPDIRNAVQSPNKNRTRFSGSYRSSVGSVISCRRKLFTEFEQSVKRPKLTSPVLCQKTKSNKKEIKLSLKKKFPGVPNSDSARSGLLLNLAFSKYNLSNSKKEDVAVDFVDNASGCTTTKKDFVHYSHIKQDDSSRCRSPVFMAIKKVKRKLNLEDQSTFVSNKSIGSNTDEINVNQSKDETSTVEPVHEKQNQLESKVHSEAYNILEFERKNESIPPDQKPKNSTLPAVTESVKENQDSKRHEPSTKIFTPFSPIISKQTNMGHYSSSMEKLKIAKCKNNLFKNSKIRSTLRDKIFDLSKINTNSDAKITNETIDDQSPIEDGNSTNHNQISIANKSGNIRRSGVSTKENSSRNVTIHSSGPNGTKICKSRNSRQSKKWINHDSFQEHNSVNRQFKLGSVTSCDQKFLKSHMNRFLADCLTFAGQRSESDNEGFPDKIARNAPDDINSKENIIIDDEQSPNKESTDFIIENVKSQDQPASKMKITTNKLVIDKKNLSCKRPDNKIENVDLRNEAAESKCDEMRIELKKFVIDEKNLNNEKNDFAIENVDSQDEVIIENVDSQCEQVIIEPIESQSEFVNLFVDTIETDDVNSLLLESQSYSMSVAVKDCILKKSTKVCKSVATDMETPSKLDKDFIPQITNVDSQDDLFESSVNMPVPEADTKIEQVSTGASYSCVRFTDEIREKRTPDSKNIADLSGLLDTSKKTKKKSIPNTLTDRLDKLLNRENSDYRMWEYEMSKTNIESNSIRKPAVFCIERMWKEYSHLILLCSYFHEDSSSNISCEFNELKSFAKDVSNSIVIILEQDCCPKNLSYSSVFQVHPPWKLLNFEKCAPLLMLKPRKISIMPSDENSVLYKDPTIPNSFIVTRQRELCSCGDLCCDCGLPDSYQFLIQPLLFPDLSLFNRQNFSYHHFDVDTFNSRHINDVFIKHKLFPTSDLTLDVQVLHSHKDESVREFSFWYFVCLDEEKNVCCVLADGKTNDILPYVDKGVILKFTGISPWKLIPSKNVMIFLQYLNFINFPDDVKKVIDSQNIVVFLLSNEHGNVECVY
ncbi:uncharacterized protein LOC135842154 [Planococcus citri]|uniref:uncharacterized protein LOC135842154 n=1 Tax=Planococcus citri TaxID=170843 RepID=UPI0031F9BC8D